MLAVARNTGTDLASGILSTTPGRDSVRPDEGPRAVVT